MKMELYTYVYNDEDILPFFLQYYSPIVNKMTFVDSGSTDKTLKLLREHEVIQTGLTWWNWDELHKMKNNIWRQSRYDLVFFPDVDEFLYRGNLREFLETNTYDIYQMEGYQMVSDNFPKAGSNILDIKRGIPLPLHNKFSIFSPKVDIHFDNAHTMGKTSKNICKFQIKLLHYKYLGAKNMLRRAQLIKERVPLDSYTACIKGNILSVYPTFVRTEEDYKVEIEQMLKAAKKVI